MSDEHKYDNPVQPDNKFGHALTLMERHLGADTTDGVHLDLACGFGHIAEPIVERFGLHYIGVDVDDTELEELRARGMEAHSVDLTDPRCEEVLRKILDGRRLVSVTFLDGLEHLVDGSHALAALGTLLSEHRALAVTSVPNVTHLDVGIKTLLGRWDYTEAGLLDRTHYQLYSEESLQTAMRRAGLSCFDKHDVVLARSDQYFPTDHAGLAEHTAFSRWLRSVRHNAEPNGQVNQFVWALTAVPAQAVETEAEETRSETFLSVVMRTQGRRSQEFREALLCLAAQTCTDFEVLVIAHRTTVEEQKAVEAIIEEQPEFLRRRIRLVLLDRGNRSAPLNLGLEQASGRYIAIFDDDDLVMGEWVAEFLAAEREHGGRVLRTVALRQSADVDTVRGLRGVRANSAPIKKFSTEFSLTEHLVENQSPPIGWIFPRSLVVDFGVRYDESMTTTEDWEFLLRAAEIAGVTDVSTVTAIYRWWDKRESSRTLHKMDEWVQNQHEIERRVDARPFLLPAGETRIVREDLRRLRELDKLTTRQRRRIEQLEKTAAQQRQRANKLKKQLAAVSGGQVPRGGAAATPSHGRVRRALRPRTRLRELKRRLHR